MKRIIIGCAIAASVLTATSQAKGPTVWLASFTIDNLSPENAVFSDAVEADYQDYRLGTGLESDPNFCVEASPNSTLLFVRLNRKLDGDDGFMRCDTPTHEYSQGKQRQFTLKIRNDSACWELWTNGYLSANSADWHQPCDMTGGPNPRIRLGNLWAKSPRFPVLFHTTNPSGGSVTYVVETDANVTVTGPGNSKVVTYGGTARLHKFAPNAVGPVAEAFQLPFHLTFTRVSQ